ncbi:MAG: helix-turn-helix transcriptional regulator, partial [Eggerthellaceae bacterium]|nr:helix-turn-helix transcriptional regulator [Eggerthellaceae bacterium]
MSFRDNLLRLRTEHGLTQEQLASQIGVSRQSVAKWESDRSYPEMDKLIKMTGIFGCTLDELVMGPSDQDAADDRAFVAATGEPAAESAAVVEEQHASRGAGSGSCVECAPSLEPATDAYGYDAHMRSYAKRLAGGVAVIIAGVPAFIAANGLLGADSEAVNVFSLALLLGFIIAGLALIIPSVMGHSAFMREHPVVRDFYSLADKQLARQALSRGIVVGIALIFAGIIVSGIAGVV